MSTHTVRVLHVEDDVMQQRVIVHHLKAMSEFSFVIMAVASEELAMESFQKASYDLVLLDYHLAQGNGLHLLFRMREVDPIVPIIAISGVATAEVAAKLVQAGADDYFDKRELSSANLAKSIRSCLRRTETVRNKFASPLDDNVAQLTEQMTELCRNYVRRIGADMLGQLDLFTQDVKNARIPMHKLQRIHETALSRVEVLPGLDRDLTRLLARPLLFELLIRAYDDPDANPA